MPFVTEGGKLKWRRSAGTRRGTPVLRFVSSVPTALSVRRSAGSGPRWQAGRDRRTRLRPRAAADWVACPVSLVVARRGGERRQLARGGRRPRRSRTSRPRLEPRTRRKLPRWRRSPACSDPESWLRPARPTAPDWPRSPVAGCWRRRRPRRRPPPPGPGLPSARPVRRCCSATSCTAPPRLAAAVDDGPCQLELVNSVTVDA